MPVEDIAKIVAAVTVSFGGGAAIVIALSGWLGNLWAQRVLQRERSALQITLDDLRHERDLAKSSYDHYLDLILTYYKTFYDHYRLCQRTAFADAHRDSAGKITFTKDEFLLELDGFLERWAEQEGRIRLLLPAPILQIHNEAIDSFNEFKHAVDGFKKDEESGNRKRKAFEQVEAAKVRMEQSLRDFLRTERLLK